jgi:hypothetical protein
MKLIVKIHIFFAVFFVVAIVSAFYLMTWLGRLHELPDPSHTRFYFWRPKVEVINFALTYGTIIFWLLFAVCHLIVTIRKKLQQKSQN